MPRGIAGRRRPIGGAECRAPADAHGRPARLSRTVNPSCVNRELLEDDHVLALVPGALDEAGDPDALV